MQDLKIKRGVPLRWSIATSIATVIVILLASTLSRGQHESSANKIELIAAGTDAAPQVIIDNYAFSPVTLTVKVGTTVTFINRDDDAHTVDSTQGKFKSPLMNKNGSFEFRFTAAGEYPYSCGLHPKMTGKIIVQP